MIRVMIVDDSALVRSLLSDMLSRDPGIEVVATASDPYFARDKFKKLQPDVLTLDVEMPRMDGLTFLEKLMSFRPTPVVMISSLTERGAQTTLQALALGAVDFVTKPSANVQEALPILEREIVAKVKAAARANMKKSRPVKLKVVEPGQEKNHEDKVLIDDVLQATNRKVTKGEKVICIGASTGGTVAIESLLTCLPGNLPGIVIVQHMPAGFTKAFADRVNLLCEMEVVEGEPGMDVSRGRAIIAPGGRHMLLQRKGSGYYVDIKDGPPVNRHKPSVDVLFRSAANSAGANALGVILTGMGDDGAKGMLDLYNTEAYTIAQDEKSCVVFGMPRVAIELGGVEKIASLETIPSLIVQLVR